MEDDEDIEVLIDEKLQLAQDIIDKLEDLAHIEGSNKTKQFVQKEIKFLKKLKNSGEENVNLKLQCTNLNFYHHLVECVQSYQKSHKILSMIDERKKHVGSDCGDDSKFRIDILCENESLKQQLWVKIIARSSSGISAEVAGNCSFGTKNIVDVAEEYLELAQHFFTPNFRPPKIIFDFLNRISEGLQSELEEMGVIIGKKYRNCEVKLFEREKQNEPEPLNLDVTAMLAYVSDLSNGGCDYNFSDSIILKEQAAQERVNPVKPFLDKTFKGKRLIACQASIDSFQSIIETLAGENERNRASELLKSIQILPNVEKPEEIIKAEDSHRVKERSRQIFAFGIYHKAYTLTSNHGFIRAVKSLNLDLPAILHSPRALSEQKVIKVDNV